MENEPQADIVLEVQDGFIDVELLFKRMIEKEKENV